MRRILKVIFSRYMISGLILLLEIGFLGYLFFELSSFSIYFFIISLIIDIIALVAIINGEYNPEYKVTWMAIVFLVPGFGALLYILFRHRKMGKIEYNRSVKIREQLKESNILEDNRYFSELRECDYSAYGKARGIKSIDLLAKVYKNTSSKYYALGEDMYQDMLKDLKSAKKYIFLEYFIIERGKMWDGILEILKEKVQEGLDVRVSYDDLGCMSTLPDKYYKELRKYGINCHCFSKFNPYVSTVHNNRDHRKFLIIDGEVGYTGGINLADEYINEVQRFGHWKDGGVRIVGDAVEGMLLLFLALWSMNTGEDLHIETLLPQHANLSESTAEFNTGSHLIDDNLNIAENQSEYLKTESEKNENLKKSDTGTPVFDNSVNNSLQNVETGDGGFYIPYGSGPAPMYLSQVGKRVFLDIINQAKKYVYITTPYLIIDFDLTESLCGAAARGVDVRIITPGIADKKIVKIMTKSSYPHLMKSGVKIFEYTPGFIHEKTVVSDDEYAVSGTVNFDYRSLVHHFEDGIFMFSTPTVFDIRNEYLKTIDKCKLMTDKDAKLNLFEWLIRCGIRLFAPLL